MLRHTYASHCIAQGIPTRVLMLWGGWESEAMLSRYAHLQPRDLAHWADRIAPKGGPLRVVTNRSAVTDLSHRTARIENG